MRVLRSVLVVDDDAWVCQLLTTMLQSAGHSVTCVEDARSAIRLVRERWFDVVITDMLLGDEDGTAVVLAARAVTPTPRVIVMSGGGNFVRASVCLGVGVALGACLTLPKPFSRDELMCAVDGTSRG